MKIFLAALFLSLGCIAFAQTNQKSEIKRVTLFAQNAQIEREAQITLRAGEQKIVFTGISTKVLANSIRVKTNNSGVIIRQSNFKTEYVETATDQSKTEALYTELENLKRELELIDAQKVGLLKEREFLNQNTTLGSREGSTMPLAQFQQMGSYFRTQMAKVQGELYDLEVKRNKKVESINGIMAKLKLETSVTTKTVGLIEVTVEAKTAGKVTFSLDFLVSNAGWKPEYELRVADINQPVALELQAKMYQETGVDWENVQLSFSTGDPQRSSQAPNLDAWYITQPVAPLPVYNNQRQQAQNAGYTGRFTGIVKSQETKQGIRGAIVVFIGVDGKVLNTMQTSYDGSYTYLSNTPVLKLQYAAFGYETQERAAGDGRVEVQLRGTSQQIDEVVIIAEQQVTQYSPNTSSAGVYQDSDGQGVNIRGGRESANVVFIDGVKVRGSVDLPSGYQTKESEKYARVQRNASQVRKAIAQRFVATAPYSVPTTGEEVSVSLQELKLPVSYRYFAVPKLDEDAFLEAQLFGWDTLGLISGEMKIFVEGNFVGNSKLDAASLADTLNLSLGRDPNVVVKRTVINSATNKSFFGGKITRQTGYKIEVRNNKKTAITLYVQDQYPLSPSEDISIKRGQNSGGIVDAETGIVTWKMDLAPSQQQDRILDFIITYPRSKQVYF